MRLQGIITKATYLKGVSERTHNPYELVNYEFQHTDKQGHNHLLTFTLFAPQIYEAKVHKGDHVEVSVQLGLRDYKGNKYNEVSGVYYVGKIQPIAAGMAQAQPAQTMQQMPQTIQPSAPVFQQGQAQQAQPMMAVNNQNGGAYQQTVAAQLANAQQPMMAAPQPSTAEETDDLPF